MLLDENLYWHDHVDQTRSLLVKYFYVFILLCNFKSCERLCPLRIARQLYFAFIYSRIQYGTRAYGSCARENTSNLQIMQNKLLKLLFKWDRRASTDCVHHRLSILEVNYVHSSKILSRVNECRVGRLPDIFVEYHKTRERGLNLRKKISLYIPWARTETGLSLCDIKVQCYGIIIYKE